MRSRAGKVVSGNKQALGIEGAGRKAGGTARTKTQGLGFS